MYYLKHYWGSVETYNGTVWIALIVNITIPADAYTYTYVQVTDVLTQVNPLKCQKQPANIGEPKKLKINLHNVVHQSLGHILDKISSFSGEFSFPE